MTKMSKERQDVKENGKPPLVKAPTCVSLSRLSNKGYPPRALAKTKGDMKAGSVIAIFIFFSISSARETTSSSA